LNFRPILDASTVDQASLR